MFCENCGHEVTSNFCGKCGLRAAMAPAQPPRDPLAATRNTARVAAITALVGFMLPWLSSPFAEKVHTGIEAASNGGVLLWIVPMSMVVVIGVLLNRRVASQRERFAAKIAMIAALASLAVIWILIAFHDEGDMGVMRWHVEYGAGISLLASVMVGIAGLMHLRAAKKLSPPGVSWQPAGWAA
jgi:hypothetical protein